MTNQISLSFINVGSDQVITLLYWGSIEAGKEHAKELEKITGSMKQLKEHEKGKAKKEEET